MLRYIVVQYVYNIDTPMVKTVFAIFVWKKNGLLENEGECECEPSLTAVHTPCVALSDAFKLKGTMQLRETPGTYDFTWHNAPRRQFIINFNAAVQIEGK